MTSSEPQGASLTLVRRIGASAEQLYRAWTDPALMMRWFAPAPCRVLAVEADPRVGGRYRIVVADGHQQHVTLGEYVELVPARRVVKTWLYRGPLEQYGSEPSLVTVEFRALAATLTELTLTHTQLAAERARRDTTSGWLLCLDALEDAHAPEHRFSIVRTIQASPEEAYAAWTEPALLRRWFGTVVEADVRVGGTYRVENHEAGQVYKHKGEYRVLEPGRRIVKTFVFDGAGPPGAASEYTDEVITISFRALGPRLTELTLSNCWNGKGVDEEERENLKKGWDEWLDRLARTVAREVGQG